MKSKAVAWMNHAQHESGGWGGDHARHASIEETALAVEGLVAALNDATPQAAIVRGVHWLIEHTARGTNFPPSPIGFYFAKLWYYEKLYPIIFTVAALERVAALLESESEMS